MANPRSPVIPAEHFNSLFTVLLARGFRIIGPTVRSGAVVIDILQSVSDLPAGWTDSQQPGLYRLTPASTDAILPTALPPTPGKNGCTRHWFSCLKHSPTGSH